MFAPGRVLVQQDYWKDSDNLRVAESVVAAVTNPNPNTTTPASNKANSNQTTLTSQNSRSNANNKKPNTVQSAAANMTPNNSNDSSTNKIDFSLFEEKQPK